MTGHANNDLHKLLTLALGDGGLRKAIDALPLDRRGDLARWAHGHSEQSVSNAGIFARIMASSDTREVDPVDLNLSWWIICGLLSEAEVASTIETYALDAMSNLSTA